MTKVLCGTYIFYTSYVCMYVVFYSLDVSTVFTRFYTCYTGYGRQVTQVHQVLQVTSARLHRLLAPGYTGYKL